jgi:hypothetical protein
MLETRQGNFEEARHCSSRLVKRNCECLQFVGRLAGVDQCRISTEHLVTSSNSSMEATDQLAHCKDKTTAIPPR